ncbi:MAG TPA: AMP-binding protein [Streptosporangiaceae bacterium]
MIREERDPIPLTTLEAGQAREALRASWRAAGWYQDLTVGEAIAAGARQHPDDELIFVRHGGGATAVRLATLHERALDVAGRLYRAGVRPGEVVVLQAAVGPASTEAAVAVWALGAVPVLLTAAATPGELAHVLAETGARTVVTARRWRGTEVASSIAGQRQALGLDRLIVLGEDAPHGALALDALPAGPRAEPARPAPASVAVLLYTSGSTAAPKGVQHSHESLLFGLTAAAPAGDATRSLMTFPAGHIASLLAVLRPLVAGGLTVMMDSWSPAAAAELIETYQITASAGTPFFLTTLLDQAERSGRDISTLQRFLVGAAAVPPGLVARAEAAGITAWRTYGSTEHPAISSGGPDDPPGKRRLTDGRVAPGNEVRLVDESGADVTPGAEGEIVARGPRQFVGYRDPALNADAYLDGTWFRTGDLARFDPDGYLVVTDRVKDIIIRGGENISAREVEEALAGAAGIREIAICAAPDQTWGEIVCAVVVPGEEVPTLESLRERGTAAGLARHKLPARLLTVDSLPRTAAGKVRKADLRHLLARPADGG